MMKMRKDTKPDHSDSALFSFLLNPLQAFDPPPGIERVLVFPARDEKLKIIEDWRIEFNTFRPHRSLKGLTREEFLQQQNPELSLKPA